MGEWTVFRPNDPDAEIIARRFGKLHKKPCKRRTILTCSMPECQYADECRASPLALSWEYLDSSQTGTDNG